MTDNICSKCGQEVPEKHVWVTKDGRKLFMRDILDDHLKNICKMQARNKGDVADRFAEELKLRGLINKQFSEELEDKIREYYQEAEAMKDRIDNDD